MSSSNTDDLKVKRAGERKQSKSFRLALRALLKRHSRDYEQATVAVSTDDKTEYVYQALEKTRSGFLSCYLGIARKTFTSGFPR